uniref:ShKT domain-containing protein n=1 Tax=Strongyloides venezuelensis TaxID=75913 RepID=A0A0K0FPG6_STRVS
MPEKTRKMNIEFARIVYLQSLIPVLVTGVPMIIFTVSIFLRVEVFVLSGLTYSVLLVCCVPAMNALFVIILLLGNLYGIKSEDLTTEARGVICDLIAKYDFCNNSVMRSYVCNNCESECKGKIDPDCSSFIGECKDYYNYCPDVVSQCHVPFMTSFLYKYCPVTCEQCVPTNNTDKTGEIPIEIETTTINSEIITDSPGNIPIEIETTTINSGNVTDVDGEIPVIDNGTSNISLISTTTTTISIPTVDLLPSDNSSNIIKSTKLK